MNTDVTRKKNDAVRFFTESVVATATSRSALIRRRAPRTVLERRLAGADAADARAVELPEQRLRQLEPARQLDEQELRLLALLDRDRLHARHAAQPLDRIRRGAERLDLDDCPLGDERLEVGGRALRDDLATGDDGDAVA
jgi:hypothetical protein